MEEKLSIRFFYRKRGINYSIERVFDTIYLYLKDKVNIDIKSVNYSRIKISNIFRNLNYCYKNRINGVNHIVGDIHYVSIVLPSRNTILTIHDMVGFYQNKGFKRLFTFIFWYYIPCKKNKYITCISESTKLDLIKLAKCNPNKITVIPNPVSPEYHYIHKEFNENCPIILHIGTRNNKNLERVIGSLKDISCHLRIIGELNSDQILLLKQNNIIYSNSERLTDFEIVKEYMNCDIVSFPSLFEGFGMPIIEGQATGRIVLTSNLEPMKSISNNATILVDPNDVLSIREGFKNIISDKKLRENLIRLGLENAKKYSVQHISNKYLNLYFKIMNN